MLTLAANYGFVLLFRRVSDCQKRRFLLTVGIGTNVVVLFSFKYLQTFLFILDHFLGTSMGDTPILSPSGLSFITFQQIIYLVDAYHDAAASDSILDYLYCTTWFPKILSGPITQRSTLLQPFRAEDSPHGESESRPIACGNILSGLVLFCYGLGKKVLLADVLALAVDWGFENLEALTSLDALIIMLAYTFQIYYDFSGYTDMARGVSRMAGIELPINFDSPYRSLSIRDFWKRWHLSLTQFLTQYIYIPLGGSRKGKAMTWRNTMIVFLVSGIWHGSAPSFVLWGVLHGLLNIIDRESVDLWEKIPRLIRWCLNFICINFLWLLFRSRSISKFLNIVRAMLFGGTGLSISSGLLDEMASMSPIKGMDGLAVLILYLFVSMVICLLPRNTNRIEPDGTNIHLPQMLPAVVILLSSLFYLGEVGTFLYYNF